MAQIKDTDKKGAAKIVGKLIAERASEAGIKQVVFDRGRLRIHGAAWPSWPPAPAKPDLNSK